MSDPIYVETINPQKVVVSRILMDYYTTPKPDDQLYKSIKTEGQLTPIVLSNDMVLIDGLRRLDVARALGRDVLAVVCTDYESIVETMVTLYQSDFDRGMYVEPKSSRIYQLYKTLIPISRQEETRGRKNTNPIRVETVSQRGGGYFRRSLVRALGTRPGAITRVQDIVTIFNMATNPASPHHKEARTIAGEVEAGRITPNTGLKKLYARRLRTDFFLGNVTAPSEQRDVLSGTVASFNGMVRALLSLGPVDKITPGEIREAVESLRSQRQLLNRFIRLIEEKANG